jgi:hypothetical protein
MQEFINYNPYKSVFVEKINNIKNNNNNIN